VFLGFGFKTNIELFLHIQTHKVSILKIWFLAHDSIFGICLSICLLHGWNRWIIQKRLKFGLWNFHH